jgi:hypothetical protein
MLFNGLCILIGIGFFATWRRFDAIDKKLDKVIEQLNQNRRAIEGAAWPPYAQAPAARPKLKGQEPNQ